MNFSKPIPVHERTKFKDQDQLHLKINIKESEVFYM